MQSHSSFCPADTVDLPSIRGAVQAVETHLQGQGLNLLINNAGVGSQATLQSVDAQEMLTAFAVNVVGPLQVAKVCVGQGCSSVACNHGVRTSRARLKTRVCINRALMRIFLPGIPTALGEGGEGRGDGGAELQQGCHHQCVFQSGLHRAVSWGAGGPHVPIPCQQGEGAGGDLGIVPHGPAPGIPCLVLQA